MPQYELNVRDYLRIFRKRKLVIILTFIIVTASSTFYVSMQPHIYESSTTIKILERQTIAGILTEWIVYSPADTMESQAKMISGFPIMKRVALHLGLIDANAPLSEIQGVIGSLQARVSASIVGQTNLIKITAVAGVPGEARDLAKVTAQVYVEENLLEKKKQASTARQFIETQLDELEHRLVSGEERLRQFSNDVKNIKLAEPMQQRLVGLEFELVTLLQRYTEKHPQVVSLKEGIANLEAQLEGFSEQELQYARLAREVEVSKRLFAMLKERLEEARITEAQKVGSVSIVDPAFMPSGPIAPNKQMATVMGGIVGIVLGIVLAFIFETADTSIGTIEDVEKLLKLPVLGVVPSVSSELKEEKGIFMKLRKKLAPAEKSNIEEAYTRLIVHYRPRSFIAEAYRSIRTNLKLTPSQKTILVTSAEPREGKTTILVNLGLAFAQKGAKTLLISSDMRRPALARTFGIEREPGLNEVMTGAVKLDDALRNISDIMLGSLPFKEIIKTPGIENIWILTSGHVPLNPAEILESKKLPSLIEEVKSKFDIIFFDSPPALPITDASLLASKMDIAIMCYEIGRTSREALLRTKIQLESVGAKIAGVILNHISLQAAPLDSYPYYYYRYKHKYRYYDKENEEKEREKEEVRK